MLNKFITLLVVFALAALPACRGHRGFSGQNGQDGTNGQDGINGVDGIDGLDGLGFDYVRSMDGATVTNSVIVVPAHLVLPASILAFAPQEDANDADGLTLTFGTTEVMLRVYLGEIKAGEHCVVEKQSHWNWQTLGTLNFETDGFVAVVPQSTFVLFDPAFTAQLVAAGVLITFSEDELSKTLDYSERVLKVGKDIKVTLK